MKSINVMGIDLSKNVFQLHGVDEKGQVVLTKRKSRAEIKSAIANIPKCVIGMEACGGSNYWAREFRSYGHEVKVMAAQFVKPYVKSNKNDKADAEAICEAVSRPNMRFVGIKTVEQQDIQSLHRIRRRCIGNRTALTNETRGLLLEYGIAVPKGVGQLRKALPVILEDEKNELTAAFRSLLQELREELVQMDAKLLHYDTRIKELSKSREACQRLEKIPGVGPITSTAIVAAVGNPQAFKNGREFAAWLGLVPRQHSTGGKERLGGISKRGDKYLRTMLVHGARAEVRVCAKKTDPRSLWAQRLMEKRGKFKTYVAVANKNARVIWKLLATGCEYQSSAARLVMNRKGPAPTSTGAAHSRGASV